MSILRIEQTDDVDIDADAISNAISTTKRGDTVSFDGYFLLDKPIRFIRGRDYTGNMSAVFRAIPEWNGPLIEMNDLPDAEKSLLEKIFSYDHALGRRLIQVFIALHIRIPTKIYTSITGFTFHGNGPNTTVYHSS